MAISQQTRSELYTILWFVQSELILFFLISLRQPSARLRLICSLFKREIPFSMRLHSPSATHIRSTRNIINKWQSPTTATTTESSKKRVCTRRYMQTKMGSVSRLCVRVYACTNVSDVESVGTKEFRAETAENSRMQSHNNAYVSNSRMSFCVSLSFLSVPSFLVHCAQHIHSGDRALSWMHARWFNKPKSIRTDCAAAGHWTLLSTEEKKRKKCYINSPN